MSEKVSEALIKLLNEVSDVETQRSKVEASIFIKKADAIIKEKISYLFNLLGAEAQSYGQKGNQFEITEKIISAYKEKLNMVYDEIYLKYVNIQNELSEARASEKMEIINYQKIVNENEETKTISSKLKDKIKNKKDVYEEIIQKCETEFENFIPSFENLINSDFTIEGNLEIQNENGFFQKIKNKIRNMFNGKNIYLKSLKDYEEKVNNIDVNKITKDLREETVEFVTDILEIKDIELDEAV